ncbi:MAG: YbgC/FadM family acyl-CoA thioesterase [Pseudomonadota bacterium]|nr:YbgC/FadM family acyl-CoA thioesterase [Pseudomonadota bacterium]
MITDMGDPLQQTIQDRIHNLLVRVYYEDTDFSGVVYHANYLRFAERGRSEFLHACGIHHSDLFSRPDPLAFTVVNMNIDFLAPAKIDDRLAVISAYIFIKGARLHIKQAIMLGSQILWRADVHVACITAAGRPVRMPKDVKSLLEPHLTQEERFLNFINKP